MGLRVALYARVSTKQHGQNPETQLMPLRDAAKARGLELAGEYVDWGISGSKERRPELDRLMADAKERKFDMIMVARFDRFARSTKHLLTALDTFRGLKIDFVSLNESLDSSTAVGRLIFSVLAAVAEMERSLVRERVQAGVDRAKRQGKRLGRPPKNLYDRERVVFLVDSGRSVKSVAKELGISRPLIDKIMRLHRATKQSEGLCNKPAAAANVSC